MTEFVEKSILKIKNPKIKAMLLICQKNRKYPLDCLTDGALQILTDYISSLEDEAQSLKKKS